MSSRRKIGLVSRRQREQLIRKEVDNLMNETDSTDSCDSADVNDRHEHAVPDVSMQHIIEEVTIEPIAVYVDETDSDLDLSNQIFYGFKFFRLKKTLLKFTNKLFVFN